VTPYARPHDEVALAVCWASALALANMVDGVLRSTLVIAVVGVALVLPWTLTVLSLLGAPLALHILVTLATAVLTAYSLRQLGPVSRSSTTARTSP
jgi:hypothetical protein